MPRSDWRDTGLLVLTAAAFGAAPLLIALAVQYFPPLTLGALRAALGLPLLLIVAGLIGKPGWNGMEAVVTALVGGLLVIAVPFVTLAVGLQYIPSGMGGLLYATMPIFTLALAALFLRDEPVTLEQSLRIALGLGGVALIAGPSFVGNSLGQAGVGTLFTLLAPLSYAAGNVWFRRRKPVSPLLLNAAMFGVGAVATWPVALLVDGRVTVEPSGTVIGILIALIVLATVAPAILNYMLVRQVGANRASLVMFVMPGFSVLLGMVFLNERLPFLAFAGLALVILAARGPMPRVARRRVVAS
ncbi:DMT family transporter [Roseibaca sp. Y0-43]|uniref:DMT family transporter n=1 Tax=Roseibaca sp. Y0-43 TaxID=2816854 RepID=UPI001D0C8278|nr:DMT family transporter [Roseibaca sp. Y0-43]MCC1481495.1 DMT family transporter [Roseibaca sp. Y0-43]